jgi:hypothetical protein
MAGWERRQVIAEEAAWRAARAQPGHWTEPPWPDRDGPPQPPSPEVIAGLYRALRKERRRVHRRALPGFSPGPRCAVEPDQIRLVRGRCPCSMIFAAISTAMSRAAPPRSKAAWQSGPRRSASFMLGRRFQARHQLADQGSPLLATAPPPAWVLRPDFAHDHVSRRPDGADLLVCGLW